MSFFLDFIFFIIIFLNFKEKPDIFNIGIVSYSVSLQLWLGKIIGKTRKGPINNLKMVPNFFRSFWNFLKACLVRHKNKDKLKLRGR